MTDTRTDAVADTQLDPTTDAPAEQVHPPRDYPFPEWQDTGDYAVPEHLRAFYAGAEPSDLEKQGYIEYGVSIGEPVTVTRQRLVSSGRDDGEPVVVEDPDKVTTLRDLRGAADYPRWLHLTRLQLAAVARKRDDHRALMESRYSTCDVCGVRNAGVRAVSIRPHTTNDLGGNLIVLGCPAHLPVLERVARSAVEIRATRTDLPDGRTVGEVADAVVADRLVRLDDAS